MEELKEWNEIKWIPHPNPIWSNYHLFWGGDSSWKDANAPSGSVYRAIKDVSHPQSLVQAVHAPLTEVARALVQALQADPKIQGNTCETQVSSW